jgi:hypothetical protein
MPLSPTELRDRFGIVYSDPEANGPGWLRTSPGICLGETPPNFVLMAPQAALTFGDEEHRGARTPR